MIKIGTLFRKIAGHLAAIHFVHALPPYTGPSNSPTVTSVDNPWCGNPTLCCQYIIFPDWRNQFIGRVSPTVALASYGNANGQQQYWTNVPNVVHYVCVDTRDSVPINSGEVSVRGWYQTACAAGTVELHLPADQVAVARAPHADDWYKPICLTAIVQESIELAVGNEPACRTYSLTAGSKNAITISTSTVAPFRSGAEEIAYTYLSISGVNNHDGVFKYAPKISFVAKGADLNQQYRVCAANSAGLGQAPSSAPPLGRVKVTFSVSYYPF